MTTICPGVGTTRQCGEHCRVSCDTHHSLPFFSVRVFEKRRWCRRCWNPIGRPNNRPVFETCQPYRTKEPDFLRTCTKTSRTAGISTLKRSNIHEKMWRLRKEFIREEAEQPLKMGVRSHECVYFTCEAVQVLRPETR